MNFLQKIGLVKDDGKDEAPPITTNQQRIAAPLVQTFGGRTEAIQTTFQSVGSTNEYDAHLDTVLEAANEPGFDFFEFNKTLNGLDGKPLAEQQKYETAFIAADAMGVTANALIQSGQRYVQRLDKEALDFKAEMDGAQAQQVTAKKEEVQRLAQRNAELAAEIESNNQKSQTLNMEVLNSSNVLGGKQQAFEYALNNRKGIINDRLSKIKTYLNGITS